MSCMNLEWREYVGRYKDKVLPVTLWKDLIDLKYYCCSPSHPDVFLTRLSVGKSEASVIARFEKENRCRCEVVHYAY